jgi:hypothetical protein
MTEHQLSAIFADVDTAVAELRATPDYNPTWVDAWIAFRKALRLNGVRNSLTDEQQHDLFQAWRDREEDKQRAEKAATADCITELVEYHRQLLLRRDFAGPSPELETAIRNVSHAIAARLTPAAPADPRVEHQC